jgi:hypothetical protein
MKRVRSSMVGGDLSLLPRDGTWSLMWFDAFETSKEDGGIYTNGDVGAWTRFVGEYTS